MRRIGISLLIVMTLSVAAWAVGELAVDFSLQDLQGQNQRLSEQKGKVVLLSFWMTWCAPCKVEIPHLVRLYGQYKDKGFVVWGITADAPSDLPKVRSLQRAYNMTYPVLLDQDSRVNNLYNPRSDYPLSVLINREGRIVWTHVGFRPGDEIELENQIKAALGS
jgi:peroxiredoxin